MTKLYALVPAAGTGSRMGEGIPKQYRMLAGKPMIRHALEMLCSHPAIECVYVVLAEDDAHWGTFDWSSLAEKLAVLHCGGQTRAASVCNGLASMTAGDGDWVMVHDAARPCIDREALDRLVIELGDDEVGGLLALPVADTLKMDDGARRVSRTVPREGLWQAQTPQMFRKHRLLDALRLAPDRTDEAGAIEAMGLCPKLVLGDPRNFKVTYPGDIALAETILRERE